MLALKHPDSQRSTACLHTEGFSVVMQRRGYWDSDQKEHRDSEGDTAGFPRSRRNHTLSTVVYIVHLQLHTPNKKCSLGNRSANF